MKGWRKVCTVAVLGLAVAVTSAAVEAAGLKALIVNGQNNHGWQTSSPILKQILQQTGLFKVDEATSPPKGSDMEGFRPNFAEYDVVVLDYNGDMWPEATRVAFVRYVSSGGGVVVYHAANNSFPEWGEYNEIIGLGGWGRRDEKSGPYIRWRDGKVVRDMSPGRGGSHGSRHDFQVIIRNKEHPVTEGLPEKWMHAEDEMYSQLRGPAENLTVLATAYADPAQRGTGEHEPILFTISYGRGRVFHTALGHVGRGGGSLPAMECAGFITTFQRGAEWAATGKVTQKVPHDFPTATEVRRWAGYKPSRPVDELLAEIAKYEYGQNRRPLSQLTDLVRSASDSPEKLKEIERRFLEFLRSDATPSGKQFICKELSIIGSEESVPTLAAMLTEGPTSPIEPADMARYALERIPGPAVNQALCDALDKTTGKVKVGIINSLGARGASEAADELGKLLADPDKEIAEAAISALGKIGGMEAAGALNKGKAKVAAELRAAWADAYLACADKALAEGDMSWAVRIYLHMYGPRGPSSVRAAALRGLVTTMPGRTVPILLGLFKGEHEQMRGAAVSLLRETSDSRIVEAVIAEFANLPATAQVQVLSALADRGERSALDAVVDATRSSEADVRIAGFGALGVLGDASSVDLLARAAVDTEGVERQAAREALYRLRGSGVDEKILANIPAAGPMVKVELIRSIGRRNVTAGVETLLKTARDQQQEVRLESLKALKMVAAEEDLLVLIALLVSARSEAERSEAENTVVAVARKIEDKGRQAEQVLAVLRSVHVVRARCLLLGVLGKIGGRGAVLALSKALRDDDAEVRISAVRALAEWPDAVPIEDLRGVATRSRDDRERVLALRGFVRLIGLDSERPTEERVKMYKEAMTLAANVSEKKAVLSGLASVRSLTALKTAAEFLDESALQQEAEAAVVRIAESTQTGHPQQTKAILEKVLETSKNDSLRAQAQQIVQQIEKYEDYITAWQVSGPYAKRNAGPQELFKVVFSPEEGDGENAQWRMMPAGTDRERPWLLELDKAVGGEECVAYLRTKAWSPKDQRVRLEVGSNDGVKVWLNGDVVHSNNVLRTISRDEDVVRVSLRKGWNELTMKITQSGGQWSACARFVGADGGKIEGLRVAPCGPASLAEPKIKLVRDDLSMWREKTGAWQVVGEATMSPENEKLLAAKPGTGVIVNGPTGRTVDLFSKAEFGDVKAHVEFMVPRGSNSGVYFMGRYEIQILDSYGVEKPKYSDCGGIYQRWDEKRSPKGYEGHPPRVNASMPAGQWQTYDVIFRAPRLDRSGKKTANARFERVFHNGILVHEDVEVTGPTRAAAYKDEKPTGPLMLQGDHGPVAYRNIRIEALNLD